MNEDYVIVDIELLHIELNKSGLEGAIDNNYINNLRNIMDLSISDFDEFKNKIFLISSADDYLKYYYTKKSKIHDELMNFSTNHDSISNPSKKFFGALKSKFDLKQLSKYNPIIENNVDNSDKNMYLVNIDEILEKLNKIKKIKDLVDFLKNIKNINFYDKNKLEEFSSETIEDDNYRILKYYVSDNLKTLYAIIYNLKLIPDNKKNIDTYYKCLKTLGLDTLENYLNDKSLKTVNNKVEVETKNEENTDLYVVDLTTLSQNFPNFKYSRIVKEKINDHIIQSFNLIKISDYLPEKLNNLKSKKIQITADHDDSSILVIPLYYIITLDNLKKKKIKYDSKKKNAFNTKEYYEFFKQDLKSLDDYLNEKENVDNNKTIEVDTKNNDIGFEQQTLLEDSILKNDDDEDYEKIRDSFFLYLNCKINSVDRMDVDIPMRKNMEISYFEEIGSDLLKYLNNKLQN